MIADNNDIETQEARVISLERQIALLDSEMEPLASPWYYFDIIKYRMRLTGMDVQKNFTRVKKTKKLILTMMWTETASIIKQYILQYEQDVR